MNTRWAPRNGFTIIEMIVVIVVIGILATIVMVSFGAVQKSNRDSQRDRDVVEVQRALEKYYASNGVYPTSATVCGSATAACDLSSLSSSLTPNYIATIPTAPSTPNYQYFAPSAAAYGIEMNYESRPNCHRGVSNQSTNANWTQGTVWSGVAACTT